MVMLVSCTEKLESKRAIHNELKSRIGNKLVVPYTPDTCDLYKFKIVTYINGDCPSCVAELDLWENFILKIEQKNYVKFIIYLRATNIELLMENCRLLSNSSVTVVEDKDDLFYKENSLSDHKMFHTFIVNQDNKILLVGNPILNKNLETLYLKLLNNEISEYKRHYSE
jgi:hypothetical protein